MPYTAKETALFQRFSCQYQHSRSKIIADMEREVFGCDYCSTSWTTKREAQRIAQMLNLAPGKRVLDIGSGSGWPGLYWARSTGCSVVLSDVPFEGLRAASERADEDRLAERCWVVGADGAALPFREGTFDAITHSDVLCCLRDKLAVLTDCRRVIRPAGRMVFTVISITAGLSTADHQRAIDSGPAFVETALDYPAMFRLAKWRVTDHSDLTADYAVAVRRFVDLEEARGDELRKLFGLDEYAERLGRHRRAMLAIEAGLLRRVLFSVEPID